MINVKTGKFLTLDSSRGLDSVGAVTAARGEVKTAGRRVSAPPVVNSHGQQRALLREKSKENQLDRNGCQQQDRDSDKGCFDVGQYHTVKGPNVQAWFNYWLFPRLRKRQAERKAKTEGLPSH